jgi:hypothetical protein
MAGRYKALRPGTFARLKISAIAGYPQDATGRAFWP